MASDPAAAAQISNAISDATNRLQLAQNAAALAFGAANPASLQGQQSQACASAILACANAKVTGVQAELAVLVTL
jgi:hypothetical protein